MRCLAGCSLGDFATLFALRAVHVPTAVAMPAACVGGIATSLAVETAFLKYKEGFGTRRAFNTAMAMSFTSMIAMEVTESTVALYLTGGNFQPSQPQSWVMLLPSLAAGWAVPMPWNYYQIKRHGRACH